MDNNAWIPNQGHSLNVNAISNGLYRNPILYADYSDPDAIRVGDDYFMVASSFCNAPGLPVLHSKDLVSWKVINYALQQIPGERYGTPQHGCGVWAPAIRYHNGEYIVFFPMPDEGIYVTKAADPWGRWSEPWCIHAAKGWIDPCPFWDDDGRVYMASAFANSRIGFKSVLNLCELKPDLSGIVDEGKYIFDGNAENQETVEGPKIYKRNGWYYIFAPAGGVKTGWQLVLRSRNIWGPYDYRKALAQGDTPINGPHQGAWLDTQTGQDWFIHFQDVYACGRIVHLQPLQWIDDWPVIGERMMADMGSEFKYCGQPVLEYARPDIGGDACEIFAPAASDEFDGGKLGLQWQWNANWRSDWYCLNSEKGKLTLFAVEKDEHCSISNVSNLLLQKWPASEFINETCLRLGQLQDGDMAGIVSLGVRYGALAVQKKNGRLFLIKISGEQRFENEQTIAEDNIEKVAELEMLDKVYFRNVVIQISNINSIPEERISFEYSDDGRRYKEVFAYRPLAGRWVGVKNGLFCVHQGAGKGGAAEVDYFRFSNVR